MRNSEGVQEYVTSMRRWQERPPLNWIRSTGASFLCRARIPGWKEGPDVVQHASGSRPERVGVLYVDSYMYVFLWPIPGELHREKISHSPRLQIPWPSHSVLNLFSDPSRD